MSETKSYFEGKKILAVDDEKDILEIIEEELEMADIDTALDEIDRAVNDLKLRGILLRIPVNGKPMDRPEFFTVYEKMCQHNLPIWFHPHKNPKVPD